MTQAQRPMEVGHACKALQGTILGSGKCGRPRSLGCPDMPVCAGSSSADGGAVSDSSVDESDGEQLAPMLNPLAQHRQPCCSLSVGRGEQPPSGPQHLRKGPGACASKENKFSLGRRAGEGCLPALDPLPSGQACRKSIQAGGQAYTEP